GHGRDAAARVGDRGDVSRVAVAVGVGGDVAQRVGAGQQVAVGVVSVGGDLAERVGVGQQMAGGVVGVSGDVAVRVGDRGDPEGARVIGVGPGAGRGGSVALGQRRHEPVGVLLDLDIAVRVGDGRGTA